MSLTVLFLVLAIIATLIFAFDVLNPFGGEGHPIAAMLLCLALWGGWMVAVLHERAVERLATEKDQIDNLIGKCESTLPRNEHCRLAAVHEN